MIKNILLISGVVLITLLAGCSTPVTLAPVGPNPNYSPAASGDGQLQIFSAVIAHTEGDNPTWFRHANYYLYDEHGNELEYVRNSRGYYSKTPRILTLPAGKYLVRVRAKGSLVADVPVVIKAGQTTEVHLDGHWQPPAGVPPSKLVSTPSGYFVGWRADSSATPP
jgi:hypothetical protein